MAITLVDTGGDVTSGGTNPSDSLTGLAEGDVVYAILSSSENSDVTASLAMISSGYTKLATGYGDDPSYRTSAGVFRKVMGATPDTTITSDGLATSSRSDAMTFFAFRGVDATTPEDATTIVVESDSSNTPDPGSITTVTDNAWVLAGGCASLQDSDTTGGPSGYSNFTENGGGGITAYTLAGGATKLVATAGAEDPGAFGYTNYNEASVGFTIAIRPATPSLTQKDYRWRNDDGPLTEVP